MAKTIVELLKLVEMADKRLFQVLDELNQEDAENGTQLVKVSPHFTDAKKVKLGAKITMGAEEAALYEIMNEEVVPLLVLVNKKEYQKRFIQKT